MDSEEVEAGLNETSQDHFDLDIEEISALGRITHALREYMTDALWEVQRWELNYSKLSPAHQDLVPNIPPKIATSKQCIYQNNLFLKSLLDWLSTSGTSPPPLCYATAAADYWVSKHGNRINPQDADKVRYIFKNLMRDWSEEGRAEREQSYGLLYKTIKQIFFSGQTTSGITTMPHDHSNTVAVATDDIDEGDTECLDTDSKTSLQCSPIHPPNILVPGCGLARLCVELAGMGCHVLGNEHSYFMLLVSSFMLNGCLRDNQFALFPWVHSNSNTSSDSDQLRCVMIPDVHPGSIIQDPCHRDGCSAHDGTHDDSTRCYGRMGMAAGDFVEVFRDEEYASSFDAVVTCFFIDTAHNVIEYMEIIHNILKPGGWWINLGPLQWHWADAHTYLASDEMSIELSLIDIHRIAQKIGFVFKEKKSGIPCGYMSNPRSMLPQRYECAFWTAQKPL